MTLALRPQFQSHAAIARKRGRTADRSEAPIPRALAECKAYEGHRSRACPPCGVVFFADLFRGSCPPCSGLIPDPFQRLAERFASVRKAAAPKKTNSLLSWEVEDWRAMHIAALAFAAVTALQTGAPTADVPPLMRLCPNTVRNTCFIGYVTAANRIVVLLASGPQNPLIDREVEVLITPSDQQTAPFNGTDLARQIGRVVMLDGVGSDRIRDAQIVFVADPILTALYLALAAPPR